MVSIKNTAHSTGALVKSLDGEWALCCDVFVEAAYTALAATRDITAMRDYNDVLKVA